MDKKEKLTLALAAVLLVSTVIFKVSFDRKQKEIRDALDECEVQINQIRETLGELEEKVEKREYVGSSVRTEVPKEELDSYIVELLARTIWSESANQDVEGQYAVGWVIRNRVLSSEFPNTFPDVIFQKKQFSGVGTDLFYETPSEEVFEIARNVILDKGLYELPEDILFYKTNNCEVVWDYPVYDVIGDHTFYSYGG